MVRPQPKLDTESEWSFLKRHSPLGAMIIWFLCANVALGASGPRPSAYLLGAFFESALVASLLVQIIVLGFILALFPGSQLFRVCLTTTIGGFCFLSLALGMSITRSIDESLYGNLLSLAPITVLTTTGPFLIAKFGFGWKVVFAGVDQETAKPQMSIQSLIASTTLVAGSLTILNFAEFETGDMLVFAIGFAGVVSVFFLPVTTRLFRAQSWLFCVTYAVFLGILVAIFVVPMLPINNGIINMVGLGGLAMWMVVFYGLFVRSIRMSGILLIDTGRQLEIND